MAPKLGQANPLHGKTWDAWLEHVKQHAGPKYYLALYLTQALCVRISQSLMLRAEDFDWRTPRVYIRKFKGQRAVWKPILPSVLKVLKGIRKNRLRNKAGETWAWTSKGWLFPSRRNAKRPHTSKDTVCHIVAKVRQTFVKKHPSLKNAKTIRTHSGRRHCISRLSAEGLSSEVGMVWAQIQSSRVYRTYVDNEPLQIEATMKRFDRRHPVG